jgi:hypothetical protein
MDPVVPGTDPDGPKAFGFGSATLLYTAIDLAIKITYAAAQLDSK